MRIEYDRGTLVLHDLPPSVVAQDLPGAAWDPRVGRLRAPAACHAALAVALSALGVSVEDCAVATGPPPPRIAVPRLRSYQEAALGAWETEGRRGVVVLPTGAGKTRVAIAAAARAACRTLCLVPTRALLDQWVRRLEPLVRGSVGRLGDGRRDVRAVTVATFESAWRHMPRLGDRFDLLVVDEAHHFASGTRVEALEMSVADWRLGLTATPPDDIAGREVLAAHIGPVVFRRSVEDLAGVWLAPLDVRRVWIDLTVDERRRYLADRAAAAPLAAAARRSRLQGGSWSDAVRELSASEEGRAALRAWHRSRRLLSLPEAKSRVLRALLVAHRSARVLVFTADNEAAYAVARTHLVMPMTCDVGRSERAAALARFERGDLRALVSSRVLNEGIDVPAADVAIVVGGGAGAREWVQRVGRVLRPRAGKRAVVYELLCRGTDDVGRMARRQRALAPPRAA